MTTSPSCIEEKLTAELRRVEAPYRQAVSIIDAQVPETDPQPEQISQCLAQLQPILLQIRQIEATLAPLRQQWLEVSSRPGEKLRHVLNEHHELLGGLIARIDSMEHHLSHARRQMAPQLDRYMVHQQMQRAYQQSSK